jgi:hypothetical protein
MQENLAMSHNFGATDSHGDNDTGKNRSAAPPAIDAVIKTVASDPLLCGAVASMGLALGLQLAGRPKAAGFVGMWAPTLLLLGLYQRALRDDAAVRREAAGRELDEHFIGGCAARPEEAGDVDDYSECIARPHPHKAK